MADDLLIAIHAQGQRTVKGITLHHFYQRIQDDAPPDNVLEHLVVSGTNARDMGRGCAAASH